jgi:hypothetical protein
VFGSVKFRVRGRGELGRLVHYLTKYVTKVPAGGWPEWVLSTTRQLRRWSTSRNFWRIAPPPRAGGVKVTPFSKLKQKYFDPDDEWIADDEFLVMIGKAPKRSIRHRLESCGSCSVVLEEVEIKGDATNNFAPRLKWQWVGMIAAPVWRDPAEKEPVFKGLDELGSRFFVVADPHSGDLLRHLAGKLSLESVS